MQRHSGNETKSNVRIQIALQKVKMTPRLHAFQGINFKKRMTNI